MMDVATLLNNMFSLVFYEQNMPISFPTEVVADYDIFQNFYIL